MFKQEGARFGAEAGIAIGPILFVIAILGILASAIAAGSGSFTASSTTESARTKAAAIIEIGQNLKIAFDRIVDGGNCDECNFTGVVIDPNDTTNAYSLFAPTGGGVSMPSESLAASGGEWSYPEVILPYISTNAAQLAVLPVTQAVCQMINNKAVGGTTYTESAAPPSAALGTALLGHTATTGLRAGLTAVDATTTWPTNLKGKMTGCFQSSSDSGSYLFYQVMGVQ